MKIWDFAIRQPVAMTMILLAGIVLGTLSYTTIPVDLFPNVEFPVIVVTTIYPGASPEEVEDSVTSLLEEEFSALPGIDEVSSNTFEGLSNVILLFKLDKDINRASQEVQEKVNLLKLRLPDDAEEPIVRRFNPSDNPIMRFGVADSSGARSPAELRTWVEDNIQIPLQRVPGVAAVDVSGGEVREIQVNLNFQNMAARRISVQQVISALRTENLNIPGGSVTDGSQKLLVRTPGNFETVEQLNDVIIGQGQAPIYLSDVAEVVDGFQEREELTRLNGEESVTVAIRKQSGSNTLAIADGVKETLDAISQANPDLAIVIGGDESVVVRESTNGAISDLLWGALLAAFTILIFFRNFRNTFLTVVGMPLIVISSLFFMELAGISLNNVSLLALALVIGLIIDDGIVVRENILRWIERGYRPPEAASRATAEVIQPVIATTATILAVFLPVAYASGIIGRFFRSFGLTVSIAIVISTFEALTLAPMMAARFFKANSRVPEGQIDESAGREAAGRGWLDRLYSATLNWTLDHRWLTLLVAAVIVAGSVYGAGFIQQAFLPSLDRGVFDVVMKMPAGTPLEITETEAIKVEEIIRAHPWVDSVFTTIGSSTEPERASFFVKVRDDAPGQSPSQRVIDDLRQPLATVPGVSFALADGVGGGDTFIDGSKAIVVELISPTASFQALGEISQQLMAEMQAQIPGLVDVTSSYNAGKPEVQIVVDRRRAADAGLSTAQIGSSLRTLVNGEKASTFRGQGAEADIVVRLRAADRAHIDDLLDIGLVAPTGNLIQLRTVASAQLASGPTQIQRSNRAPIVSIGANVVGRSEPDAVDDVTAFLAAYPLPAGIEAKLGGDADAQTESFQNLGMALLLSVVFIYMVLAAQFGSFIQPLLIMIAMPLSIIGALLALLITDRPLDMTAFIGFIMLMGLVTKNSILLVDFANMERDHGAAADLAMRRAGPVRLRPILMTALSLILAMIPVVMGISEGGEFRQSMSIAIMGGMITSTLLTLYVVPVAYSLVIGLQDRGKDVQRYHKGSNLDLRPASNSQLALAPASGRNNLALTPSDDKGLQISDTAMGD
ncbi:MAG: efflux RND transporter permease subunit [Caldilineaceae bacterium]|nr:efflux RND transporter permease subunit [Caldilineaceae bacterium]